MSCGYRSARAIATYTQGGGRRSNRQLALIEQEDPLKLRSLHVAVVIAVCSGLVVAVATAQEPDLAVSFTVTNPDEGTNTMKATVGGEHARLDMQGVSIIWGPIAWIMVQHENQMFIRFTKEMMDRMRQMMERMPAQMRGNSIPDMDDFDPAAYSFRRTGATDTVMNHDVFEVEMTGPEGQRASLWLSTTSDVGLFEVWSRLAEHLSKVAGPMMGGGPGGRNPVAGMAEYMQLARARGLPDGRVLRMDSADGVSMVIDSWEYGPFDAWKEAPAGYRAQRMPMIQRPN